MHSEETLLEMVNGYMEDIRCLYAKIRNYMDPLNMSTEEYEEYSNECDNSEEAKDLWIKVKMTVDLLNVR